MTFYQWLCEFYPEQMDIGQCPQCGCCDCDCGKTVLLEEYRDWCEIEEEQEL